MNIYKDPVTDHGKVSKKGRMTLELDENGHYITRTEGTGDPAKVGIKWTSIPASFHHERVSQAA